MKKAKQSMKQSIELVVASTMDEFRAALDDQGLDFEWLAAQLNSTVDEIRTRFVNPTLHDMVTIAFLLQVELKIELWKDKRKVAENGRWLKWGRS